MRTRTPKAGRRSLGRFPLAVLVVVFLPAYLSSTFFLVRWAMGPAAYRKEAASTSGDGAASGDGSALSGSDSASTPVYGAPRPTPPTSAPGQGNGLPGPGGPGPGPGAPVNPPELIAMNSGDPALAGRHPQTVVFSSSDKALTGDGTGRTHALVNDDDGKVERLTGDTPATQYGGLTSGPSICASGDVVAYGASLKDTGAAAFTGRVVVVDRRSGATERVPLPAGITADPRNVVISPDCGMVAWEQQGNIYGYERVTKAAAPVLISIALDGTPAGGSSTPVLSDSGRCVAFASTSPKIVADDTNGSSDVFLRTGVFTPDPGDDRLVRISRSFNGGQTDGPSYAPSIAFARCRVAYESWATNIVSGDTNATEDVFVYDLDSDTNMAVTAGDGPSSEPWIAGSGDYVAFTSSATDLVGGGGSAAGPVSGGAGSGKAMGDTPTNFQVLDRSGRLTYGTSILAVDGPRVRVAFPASVDFGKVTAGSVDGGALTDDQIVPVDNPDGRSNTNPLATRAPAPSGKRASDDVTRGPDLTSAAVGRDDHGTPSDPTDDIPFVRFCFDKPVAEVPDPEVTLIGSEAAGGGGIGGVPTDRYLLQGYDSAARVTSQRAALESGGDARCVRAVFPTGVDVSRFTIGAVLPGAVSDADGHLAVKASKPLTGTTVALRAGDVTGPNLREARSDLTLNRVTYVFDQVGRLSPGAVGATRFGFVDLQGTVHLGQSTPTVDALAGTVSVAFAIDRDNLVLARRFFVLADAVRSTMDQPNVEQSTDGDVTGPELIAAARVGTSAPAQFDFTFNGPVTRADAERFMLYTSDGTRFPVESVTQPRPDTVRVTAPAVDLFAGAVVLGVAQPKAVYASTPGANLGVGGDAPNPLGVKPIARPAAAPAGFTDGPDLVSVTFVPDASAVDFTFDQNVRDVHLSAEHSGLPSRQTDVFVRHFPTARTIQVSVDRLGNKVRGSSSAPSLSFDGRFVVFTSSASGLVAIPIIGTGVFRRDLLVPEVSPPAIDFGGGLLGAAPAGGTAVEVINRGFGTLAVATATLGGAEPGQFGVASDGCSAQTLEPDQSCATFVTFLPTAVGPHQAALVVGDNALGSPRTVALTGTGVSPFLPRLTVVPPVGPPGIAVAVEGDGFPPGTPVQVRWTRALGDTTGPAPLTQVIRTTIDGSGHLPRTYLLVFPRDILGLRMVEVTGDRPDASASVDFVVVPGPFQPWANVMSFVRPDLIARR